MYLHRTYIHTHAHIHIHILIRQCFMPLLVFALQTLSSMFPRCQLLILQTDPSFISTIKHSFMLRRKEFVSHTNRKCKKLIIRLINFTYFFSLIYFLHKLMCNIKCEGIVVRFKWRIHTNIICYIRITFTYYPRDFSIFCLIETENVFIVTDLSANDSEKGYL